MAGGDGTDRTRGVLRSKRDATRYQILVEIADRQPAVSQQEIADAIGITPQAVSDYLQGMVAEGFVEKGGRGRYEVTKEGVDWLITMTDDLRELVRHVSEEVIGQVDVETALATARVTEGQRVSLTMCDGVLRATPTANGEATDGASALAVTDAEAGTDVGVTDFTGLLEYDPGTVTIVSLPPVDEGGSRTVDPETIDAYAVEHDVIVVAGVEALAAVRATDREPDVRFGTAAAIGEAATKGLDVLVLAVANELPAHTNALREATISYEVLDAESLST